LITNWTRAHRPSSCHPAMAIYHSSGDSSFYHHFAFGSKEGSLEQEDVIVAGMGIEGEIAQWAGRMVANILLVDKRMEDTPHGQGGKGGGELAGEGNQVLQFDHMAEAAGGHNLRASEVQDASVAVPLVGLRKVDTAGAGGGDSRVAALVENWAFFLVSL
jgi:hypothetical protein